MSREGGARPHLSIIAARIWADGGDEAAVHIRRWRPGSEINWGAAFVPFEDGPILDRRHIIDPLPSRMLPGVRIVKREGGGGGKKNGERDEAAPCRKPPRRSLRSSRCRTSSADFFSGAPARLAMLSRASTCRTCFRSRARPKPVRLMSSRASRRRRRWRRAAAEPEPLTLSPRS